MNPVRIVGFGTGLWGLPSASPFVSKLAMSLRMAGVDYTLEAPAGRPASRTGKVPYVIREDGSLLSDSSVILERLAAERGFDLDAGLTPGQRAQSLLLQRALEGSTYWSMLWLRWFSDDGWSITRANYFSNLPAPARWPVSTLVRREVRASAWGQGVGRHVPDRIVAIGLADVAAVEGVLGAQDFMFGAPSAADAVVWAFLGGVARAPYADALSRRVRESEGLMAFFDRMDQRYPPPPGDPSGKVPAG